MEQQGPHSVITLQHKSIKSLFGGFSQPVYKEENTMTAFTENFTQVDYLTELLKSREWLISNDRSTEQIDKVIEKTRNALIKQKPASQTN